PQRAFQSEVRRGGPLCPRAAGDLRRPRTRPYGPPLGHPLSRGVADAARGLPPQRERALGNGACRPVNDVGKPCAGEPHARSEAAGTGNGASPATAPVPEPTHTITPATAHTTARPYTRRTRQTSLCFRNV